MKEEIQSIIRYEGVTLIHQRGSGYHLDAHSHDFHQLIFPCEGKLSFSVDDLLHNVSRGKAIFIQAGVIHEFKALEKKHQQVIIFIEPKTWNKLKKKLAEPHETKGILKFSMSLSLRSLINYILVCNNKLLGQELISNFLGACLVEIGLQISHKMVPLDTFNPELKKVLKYINKNYASKIVLNDLSKKHGFSSRNLTRLFKSEFNMTVKQYVLQKRIARAKERILDGGVNLNEIAMELGFTSLSHFLDTYKKVTGSTI